MEDDKFVKTLNKKIEETKLVVEAMNAFRTPSNIAERMYAVEKLVGIQEGLLEAILVYRDLKGKE